MPICFHFFQRDSVMRSIKKMRMTWYTHKYTHIHTHTYIYTVHTSLVLKCMAPLLKGLTLNKMSRLFLVVAELEIA
ncbi:hypothetical protein HanHA89_Chr04g0170181 [Helianthus annuus]|nr:hypothetical protein HanHA89_Chr04g0170181 [Helianthus annuus]